MRIKCKVFDIEVNYNNGMTTFTVHSLDENRVGRGTLYNKEGFFIASNANIEVHGKIIYLPGTYDYIQLAKGKMVNFINEREAVYTERLTFLKEAARHLGGFKSKGYRPTWW